MRLVCSTPVGAVVGVPFPVPFRRPGSYPDTVVGDGGLASTPPVVGPCPARAMSTGSPRPGLRRSRCGGLQVRRRSVCSTVPMSLACPLELRTDHACLLLLGTASVVRTVSVVEGVPHCNKVPAVPPSAPCVVPPVVVGAVGSCPCGRVEGPGQRKVLPGCGGCGKTAVVPTKGLEGGVRAGVGIRGRARGPAVHLGACRCSRNSACTFGTAHIRHVATRSDRGSGLRV